MNQVPFKKIYLDVNLKNVSNKFLYSKYKNILKKKNILCYSKKNTLELSLFCWLDKNKNFVSSDFFHFLINKLWSHKTKQPLINSDLNEKKQYRILCNKLNIPDPSRVLLIQIRNSPEDIKNFTIKDFRDFDPDNLIKNLNLFKDYSFILFGDSHSRIKIEKKNLFDYSKSKFVSEKNDFLLLTNAKGCVGSFSGPSHLASIYNVPTLYINCSQFWNHPVVKNSFFVPLTFHFKSKPLKFLDFFKISPPIIWSNDHALKNLDISRKFNNSKDLRYALKYFLSFLENKKIILKNIKLRYCWWNTKFEKNFLNTNYSNYFLAPTFKFFFNNKKKYFK